MPQYLGDNSFRKKFYKQFSAENPYTQYLRATFKLSDTFIKSKITKNDQGQWVEEPLQTFSKIDQKNMAFEFSR